MVIDIQVLNIPAKSKGKLFAIGQKQLKNEATNLHIRQSTCGRYVENASNLILSIKH